MFFIHVLLLVLTPLSSQGSDFTKSQKILLASGHIAGFNPFIDYGEFEDNVTEQESINFFQKGRSLNISTFTGYEAITFNMRQIYGDSPGIIGLSIGFFFDLNFALHIGGVFPRNHYNSLLNTTPSFTNFNLDFKYYFNKQKLIESAALFNPYIVFGPFWFTIGNYNLHNAVDVSPPTVPTNIEGPTPQTQPNPVNQQSNLNNTDISVLDDFTSVGFKLGLGIEIPFIKQTYIGIEFAYFYTNLDFENTDLSNLRTNINRNPNKTFFDRLIFPDTPEVRGYRFFGDTATAIFIFGINF